MKKLLSKGIVAVAVDNFVAKGVGVAFEVGFYFFLNIDVLRVKLILLGASSPR